VPLKSQLSITLHSWTLKWVRQGTWECVKMRFKFLQNISHYYNNIFSFHMHMFTILVLSLNKLNTTIHFNIKFMLLHITLEEKPHFSSSVTKIYISEYIVKNSKNKIIIHFIIYYRKFTQKMNIKFTIKVCASLYY